MMSYAWHRERRGKVTTLMGDAHQSEAGRWTASSRDGKPRDDHFNQRSSFTSSRSILSSSYYLFLVADVLGRP